MSKLTDTQLVALSTAAQREDGAIVLPDRLKGGAAAKVMKPLLAKGLVKEISAKPGMPVWRRNEDEARSYALTITRAGRKAINAESNDEIGDPSVDPTKIRRPAARASHARNRRPRKTRSGATTMVPAAKTQSVTTAPRAGSKLALVIGIRIERERPEDGETLYRIVAESNRNAA